MDIDATFIKGIAATLSAILVFCGSAWLLLTLILGARLAYFITAAITLAFTLIMAVVWSFGSPLGPVGEMPEWNEVGAANDAAAVEFGPASEYPDEPWRVPEEEDAHEQTVVAELGSAATDALETAIDEGQVTSFEDASDAVLSEDSQRLLDQDGTEYGALTFEAAEGKPAGSAIVVMEYDPGSPLRTARLIAGGTAILFVLHLFGLSRSERRARELQTA